jgi:hypothetical protein
MDEERHTLRRPASASAVRRPKNASFSGELLKRPASATFARKSNNDQLNQKSPKRLYNDNFDFKKSVDPSNKAISNGYRQALDIGY